MRACVSATSSTTIADDGIGTGSSLLVMQITREKLGATFTCKVNSIALAEPLTVDVKLDVHGKWYRCMRAGADPIVPEKWITRDDKRFFIAAWIDRRERNNPGEVELPRDRAVFIIWTSRRALSGAAARTFERGVKSSRFVFTSASSRPASIVSRGNEPLLARIKSSLCAFFPAVACRGILAGLSRVR